MMTLRERYRGCLVSGAVGDARGAGIEFLAGLEGRDIIAQVSDDLPDVFADVQLPPRKRYAAGHNEHHNG